MVKGTSCGRAIETHTPSMNSKADNLQCALKLLETFSMEKGPLRDFERYWPLVGPVNVFCESACTAIEKRMAKALLEALDAVLERTAVRSYDLNALAVAATLGVQHDLQRPWPTSPRRRR